MFAYLQTWLQSMRAHGIRFLIIQVIKDIKSDYYGYLENKYYEQKIRDEAKAVGSGLWVGGETLVNGETVIGDNAHFLGMEIRGDGPVTIGDNFHSGSGCDIMTENHNYDSGDAIPYDDTVVEKSVEIGDNVWLGINVIVIPGVSIEEGAIVQSGSVVTDDIPKGAIAGGHPAEVFATRDMDHYEELKRQGKFN